MSYTRDEQEILLEAATILIERHEYLDKSDGYIEKTFKQLKRGDRVKGVSFNGSRYNYDQFTVLRKYVQRDEIEGDLYRIETNYGFDEKYEDIENVKFKVLNTDY